MRSLAKAVALLVLSAIACEAALRALGGALPWVRSIAAPRRERQAEPRSVAELQRGFGGLLEPGGEFYTFRRNALGFHDAEFRLDRPAGTRRIVVLGDSFAHASVPYWHSYLTHAELGLLERAAARQPIRAGAPPPVEIDNLGIPGTGIEDYLRVYRLVGRALAPDLVLINVYMGNDLADFASGERFGPPVGARLDSWLVAVLVRAARIIREQWLRHGDAGLSSDAPARSGAPSPFGRTFAPDPGWRDDAPPFSEPRFSDAAYQEMMAIELRELSRPGTPGDPHDWRRIRTAFDELVGEIALDRTPAVLVLAPSRLQVDDSERRDLALRDGKPPERFDPDGPRRWLAEYGRDRGLPVIDLTDRMRSAHAAGVGLYLNNDTHWSLTGNRVAGVELARQVDALGLLVTGRSPASPAGTDRPAATGGTQSETPR